MACIKSVPFETVQEIIDPVSVQEIIDKVSIDTVDEVAHVTNIDSVDEVVHVTNVDLVDNVALVDTLTSITNPVAVYPDAPVTSRYQSMLINTNINGNNTIIPGIGGQTIRVMGLFLQVTDIVLGVVELIFRDGAATNLTGQMVFSSGSTFTLDRDGEPWFVTTPGNAFVINQNQGSLITGRVYYTQS